MTAAEGTSAFSAGSDLWIVPERENSQLAQKLDWYLNFQMAKAALHRTPQLSQPVVEILRDCELSGYDWVPDSNEALMVLPSPFVPARWVMVIPNSDYLETWARTALEKWKQLKSPSLRVFLPEKISASQFLSVWKKLGGPETIQIATDNEGPIHG